VQNTFDTWINSYGVSEPDSKGSFMQVGQYGSRKFRGLVNWTIPTGSGKITKIEISYYCSTTWDYYTLNNGTIGIYALDKDANHPFNNNADWNKYDGTNTWTTPGTNYTTKPIDTTTIGYTSCTNNPRWINFTVMGTDAENPLNLSWENTFQTLIKQTDETLISRSDILQTQEATTNKPIIRITYDNANNPTTTTSSSPSTTTSSATTTSTTIKTSTTTTTTTTTTTNPSTTTSSTSTTTTKASTTTTSTTIPPGDYVIELNASVQNTFDTWINSYGVSEPDSKGSFMQVGQYGSRKFRGLVNWTIPAGSGKITKIEISYYCSTTWDYYTLNNGTIGIYALDKDANHPFNNNADWNKYDGTNTWTTPGTNYTTKPIDTTTIGYTSCTNNPRWINFTVMGTDAENPLNLSWENTFQTLIKQTDETLISRSDRLQTQEATTNKPKIRITYTG
jgi:hypothetical protein